MMRDSVKEFVDKNYGHTKIVLKKKDYAYTEECMKKPENLGLLVLQFLKHGGLGMGFVSTMLVCDYISGATGSFSTAFGAHTGIGTMPLYMVLKRKNKNTYLNLAG
jgi:alkylation response protein AidB-like acyl-CoA dehydrogenase